MANLSNINNYFVVDTTGKVAIGDVSAATIPTLLTQLTLYDNTATASLVIQSGAASGKKYELGSSSTGKFQITDLDASVDRLTIDTAGKVGIGTTSPSSKFQVEGAPANGVYLSYLYNSATHNSANGLNVQTSSNNILTYGLRVNTAGDSNALAVMGNGSVGIGTASPVNKIQTQYSPVAIGNLTATNDASSTTNFNVNAGLLIEDSNTSNGLALGVSGQANDRKSWIQSGHPNS